jgi:2-phospho-L-lactate guanylyltransferase (CobY/MobA/RfbA family)
MAKQKLKYDEINAQLNEFVNANYAKYESHAYAAGYLQSQLALVMLDLPLIKQKEIMDVLRRATPVVQNNA